MTLWRSAEARDPLDPSVARSKAYMLTRAGKYGEAIPLFRKLLADTPTSTVVRNGLAAAAISGRALRRSRWRRPTNCRTSTPTGSSSGRLSRPAPGTGRVPPPSSPRCASSPADSAHYQYARCWPRWAIGTGDRRARSGAQSSRPGPPFSPPIKISIRSVRTLGSPQSSEDLTFRPPESHIQAG